MDVFTKTLTPEEADHAACEFPARRLQASHEMLRSKCVTLRERLLRYESPEDADGGLLP